MGLVPRVYARAATPSGGSHEFIAPLGVGTSTGFLPGLDLKGGQPSGGSRGFVFLSPTVRRSKTTGMPVRYRWETVEDLSRLGEADDSGGPLAAFVAQAMLSQRAGRPGRPSPSTDSPLPAAAPGEEPCPQVLALADGFRKALTDPVRHTGLLGPLLKVLRAGEQGHRGALSALPGLRDDYVSAVHGSRASDAAASAEFDAAFWGSGLGPALTAPRGLYRICSCDLEAYRRQLADPSSFAGPTRRSQLRVMTSLVREAQKKQSRRIQKSTRQIAEDADCNRRTVSDAMAQLLQRGSIQAWDERRSVIVLPDAHKMHPTSKPSLTAGNEVGALPRTGPTHPLFGASHFRGGQELTFDSLDEYRDVRGRGMLIAVRDGIKDLTRRHGWRDISSRSGRGGLTPKRIAVLTEQHPQTVRRHLRDLKRHRLAAQIRGHWYRLVFDPDAVAAELGIADAPDRRRSRHDQDRLRRWEGRAALPEGHGARVDRHEVDGAVLYTHPRTGEVLWRRTV